MMKQRSTRSALAKAAFLCLVILAVSSVGCNNPAGPDEEQQPYITVRNGSGIALDIYMDGTFQFFLNDNEYYYIENVAPGTHLLEAKKKDTDILVKSRTVETTADYSYTWTITSEAALKITNKYGETLDIYGDGNYYAELADQTEAILSSVSYGSHLIEAKKPDSTTVVASTTIEVTEDTTYTWVIEK